MIIGKNLETKENVRIDLSNLIATRLLIQANSGGGKSWLIRRILEQSHGQVQQIIIDLEGEFLTLRETLDYLIVGQDGEIPANIKTAELLAKKLLKLNVSTIIDLSELKHHERILFVKRFLDSLINTPKKENLWHPCLIIIDEAHQFAPERSKAESTSSVIDLMTRGRKRGFCGILATQRISKLHKDACAETNNRLIGRTGLDIDRKRAREELGFTSKEDEISLRYLDAGEFYAFGPSISKEIIKVKIGDVKTTHPEPGKNILKASPTPPNIKKLLKNIIDLPKEVDEELKTKQDFKTKIFELKKELRLANSNKVVDEKSVERIKQQCLRESESSYKKEFNEIRNQVKGYEGIIKNFENGLKQISSIGNKLLQFKTPEFKRILVYPKKENNELKLPQVTISNPPSQIVQEQVVGEVEEDKPLKLCEKKIYGFLYVNPERQFTKIQLSGVTGYSPKSGGFKNSLSRLNSLGLIKKQGDLISIGLSNPELLEDLSFEEYSKEIWLHRLKKCPKEIYKFLLNNPNQTYTKEELAEITGYSSSSGGFKNAISKLNSLGLIQKDDREIRLNPELLEL